MIAGENSYKGRVPGSRNKRTLALMTLAEEGETPCAFALRIMRDTEKPEDLRMHAARLAAPYIHPKPQPEPTYVELQLPEKLDDAQALKTFHATLLQSIASGETSLEDGRELSAILETHRRLVETV
ncbi:MAG TPA: hypothetical protein VM144_11755, partial [Aestuariivirga sp.]|nr:hypothetical protein [Aestuariivirga sp.]